MISTIIISVYRHFCKNAAGDTFERVVNCTIYLIIMRHEDR